MDTPDRCPRCHLRLVASGVIPLRVTVLGWELGASGACPPRASASQLLVRERGRGQQPHILCAGTEGGRISARNVSCLLGIQSKAAHVKRWLQSALCTALRAPPSCLRFPVADGRVCTGLRLLSPHARVLEGVPGARTAGPALSEHEPPSCPFPLGRQALNPLTPRQPTQVCHLLPKRAGAVPWAL